MSEDSSNEAPSQLPDPLPLGGEFGVLPDYRVVLREERQTAVWTGLVGLPLLFAIPLGVPPETGFLVGLLAGGFLGRSLGSWWGGWRAPKVDGERHLGEVAQSATQYGMLWMLMGACFGAWAAVMGWIPS